MPNAFRYLLYSNYASIIDWSLHTDLSNNAFKIISVDIYFVWAVDT